MANDDGSNIDSSPQGEGWVELENNPGAVPSSVGPAGHGAAESLSAEPAPFEGRTPTPPWKYSVYTGFAGLGLLVLAYVFDDLRRIQTPWNPSFPTAYALLPFPIFALIWGIIGAVGKQFSQDRGRALLGVMLSLLAFVLTYANIVTSAPPADSSNESDQRLHMTPEELTEWRSEKLRQ